MCLFSEIYVNSRVEERCGNSRSSRWNRARIRIARVLPMLILPRRVYMERLLLEVKTFLPCIFWQGARHVVLDNISGARPALLLPSKPVKVW
jgi:hypothetical protein